MTSVKFKIIVSDAQAYKQFGNSVAVPAIQATAQKIIEKLKREGFVITPVILKNKKEK